MFLISPDDYGNNFSYGNYCLLTFSEQILYVCASVYEIFIKIQSHHQPLCIKNWKLDELQDGEDTR